MSSTSIHIGEKDALAPESEKQLRIMENEISSMTIIEKINYFLASFTPIKTTDKVTFFRLLSTMINAGISIVKALHILADQTDNPHLKKITQELSIKIETGTSLSEAMLYHPGVFTESQIGMVESGEASGRLNQTLNHIADETEKSSALLSKVKGAMIYPVTVIIIMTGSGFGVMTYVMPRIKEMFESLGGELPPSTLKLIEISDFLVGKTIGIPNMFFVLILMTVAIALFLWWKKTRVGHFIWSKAVFRMPIFGQLSKKIALARFCRILSTMVSSGISIIKALRITADTVGNPVYEKRIHQIADDVRQGITIAENIKDDESYFPSMIVGMMAVAEQTAQIDTITAKMADYYEDQVKNTVKSLSNLMEPIILVVLGGAVAFLVISVMLPILSVSDLAAEM